MALIGLIVGGLLALAWVDFDTTSGATTFTCSRISAQAGFCQLTRRALLASSSQRFDLGQVTGVDLQPVLETYYHRLGHQTTAIVYVLELNLPNQTILISRNVNHAEQLSAAGQILSFLNDPSQTAVTVTSGDSWLGWTITLAVNLIVSGLIILFAWAAGLVLVSTTYTFDKSSSLLKIEERLMVTRFRVYPLSEIQGLEVRTVKRQSRRSAPISTVFLVLTANRSLPTRLPAQNNAVVDQVRDFLRVSLSPT